MTPRVLVLDPDPEPCLAAVAALSNRGCQCIEASAASDAAPLLARWPVDVVLVGAGVPRAEAVSLVMDVRAADPFVGVVAIATPAAEPSDVDLQLGAGEWLLSPVEPHEVASAVMRTARERLAQAMGRRHADGLAAIVAQRSVALAASLAEVTVSSVDEVTAVLHSLTPGRPELVLHGKRVASQAVQLASAWGLPRAIVRDIEFGALLHDIGKLAMPDVLMQRPGPLSDAEIALVRTHPCIGADIVSRIGLPGSADIVRSAHERFDGRGYPDGLSRHAIPIGARIVAIVDVFDALTSARVYLDPVPASAAASEIVQAAGYQFDPELVRVWSRVFQWRDAPHTGSDDGR